MIKSIKNKTYIMLISIMQIVFIAGIAVAEEATGGSFLPTTNALSSLTLIDVMGRVLNGIAVLAMAAGVCVLAWGGIKHMLAGNDVAKRQDARETMAGSVFGFAIAVLSKGIWSAFKYFFGV
jgi:hypothetical protein